MVLKSETNIKTECKREQANNTTNKPRWRKGANLVKMHIFNNILKIKVQLYKLKPSIISDINTGVSGSKK